MIKKIAIFVVGIFYFVGAAVAAPIDIPDATIESDDFIPVEQLLQREPDETECATRVFADALAASADAVSESDDEDVIQHWIRLTFARGDVLADVLACPEIANAADADAIKFMPIKYQFPGGREIVVNYETQPKILKQRLALANKRTVPTDNNPSPRIGGADDTSVWTNTDPAWYAIMVVQHGALDEFVGADKNNTISTKYIEENIDRIYPAGNSCTSRSAWAGDGDIINVAVHKTTDIDGDTNDYYVAGDINLQWVAYAEIALDVVLTVGTVGGWAALSGVTKSARASKIAKQLSTSLRNLSKIDSVRDYIRVTQRSSKIADEIKLLEAVGDTRGYAKRIKDLEKLKDATKKATREHKIVADKLDALRKSGGGADDIKKLEKELAELTKKMNGAKSEQDAAEHMIRQIDAQAAHIKEATQRLNKSGTKASEKNVINEKIKKLKKQQSDIEKTAKKMAKDDKNVKKYREQMESFTEINKFRRDLRGLKIPQRGNVIARAWRAFRAANSGGKMLNRGARRARSGKLALRIRDRLFHTTMSAGGMVARGGEAAGIVYGVLRGVGNLYDYTETSTGEFTSNIEFRPLGLLSADDLTMQDNKVNYGMWLMWMGDGMDAASDDAAYLQAMDFAQKFYEDLVETQDAENNHACNVDIYVVRPVIRNPGTGADSLYYLIMNDVPWTTAQ